MSSENSRHLPEEEFFIIQRERARRKMRVSEEGLPTISIGMQPGISVDALAIDHFLDRMSSSHESLYARPFINPDVYPSQEMTILPDMTECQFFTQINFETNEPIKLSSLTDINRQCRLPMVNTEGQIVFDDSRSHHELITELIRSSSYNLTCLPQAVLSEAWSTAMNSPYAKELLRRSAVQQFISVFYGDMLWKTISQQHSLDQPCHEWDAREEQLRAEGVLTGERDLNEVVKAMCQQMIFLLDGAHLEEPEARAAFIHKYAFEGRELQGYRIRTAQEQRMPPHSMPEEPELYLELFIEGDEATLPLKRQKGLLKRLNDNKLTVVKRELSNGRISVGVALKEDSPQFATSWSDSPTSIVIAIDGLLTNFNLSKG